MLTWPTIGPRRKARRYYHLQVRTRYREPSAWAAKDGTSLPRLRAPTGCAAKGAKRRHFTTRLFEQRRARKPDSELLRELLFQRRNRGILAMENCHTAKCEFGVHSCRLNIITCECISGERRDVAARRAKGVKPHGRLACQEGHRFKPTLQMLCKTRWVEVRDGGCDPPFAQHHLGDKNPTLD